jgi:hypothetical protein
LFQINLAEVYRIEKSRMGLKVKHNYLVF